VKVTVPVGFKPVTFAIRVMDSPCVMVSAEIDSTVFVSARTVSNTA
jgi:hypothetical protein